MSFQNQGLEQQERSGVFDASEAAVFFQSVSTDETDLRKHETSEETWRRLTSFMHSIHALMLTLM